MTFTITYLAIYVLLCQSPSWDTLFTEGDRKLQGAIRLCQLRSQFHKGIYKKPTPSKRPFHSVDITSTGGRMFSLAAEEIRAPNIVSRPASKHANHLTCGGNKQYAAFPRETINCKFSIIFNGMLACICFCLFLFIIKFKLNSFCI